MSSYLLRGFSPVFLSFARITMTSAFLLLIALRNRGLRLPAKREWMLLAGAGIFGTLLNQVFYFTGLHESTAANAALIIALAPVATGVLARIFLKERFTGYKITGAFLGLAGVSVIVGFGGGKLGITTGDIYLLLAMLTLSISLLFVRSLTASLSSYAITIYSTVFGSLLMAPAAIGEELFGKTVISHAPFMWVLMAIVAVVAQGIAGFWWNRGVAAVGAGTASMFMNVPPFIALLVGHWVLGDPIYGQQILGGLLVMAGVFIANFEALGVGRTFSNRRQAMSLRR